MVNALEGRPWRLLRPRVRDYSGLLAAIAVALVVAVSLRVPLQMDVLRDRNTLFRDAPEGLIENVYTLRIMNMDSQPHTYAVTAKGIDGLALQLDRKTIQAASGEIVECWCGCRPRRRTRGRSNEVTFTLTAQDNLRIRAGGADALPRPGGEWAMKAQTEPISRQDERAKRAGLPFCSRALASATAPGVALPRIHAVVGPIGE